MRKCFLLFAGLIGCGIAAVNADSGYFEPRNRLNGVGVDRERLSEISLETRTNQMIESQTFTILRDPRAYDGAGRITSSKLQKLFEKGSKESGFPASTIAAVAYLESWGNSQAESPAGPKGVMQIAEATARSMGLQIVRKTKYKVRKEKRLVKVKRGKPKMKTVTIKEPYTVLVRDDRFNPDRAIPAAARYLARLEQKFGGRDWAIFAYHCGEGCVAEVQSVARSSSRLKDLGLTVPSVFFGAHPGYNRELFNLLQRHMERDYSPTYFFRIRRAEQLLAMYKEDPVDFKKLYDDYRNRANPSERAPHRLSVWLKPEDFEFQNCEDLRRSSGTKLTRALDNPTMFGFVLRKNGSGSIAERDPDNRDLYLQASPSALGTLAYIAFETRRVFEEMNRRGESFRPLEVTALVTPRDYESRFLNIAGPKSDFASHCTGQVFDLYTAALPAGEREALDFVLNDLGYHGYLGFVQEHASGGTLHIGPSPSSRDFFTKIWNEASETARRAD